MGRRFYCLTTLTLKNRFSVSPPYEPGFAAFHVIKSVLLPRTTLNIPAADSEMTTVFNGAVEGGALARAILTVTKVLLPA